jgi:hypothetical protein
MSSSEVISHPGFDRNKHYLLCSELKQLYVAITRTRQRLWICENADDYCQPMFDYWKKLCIVEVRLLDSSLIQAMQTGSSTDDWRLRGTKVCIGHLDAIFVTFNILSHAYSNHSMIQNLLRYCTFLRQLQVYLTSVFL